MDWKNVRNFDLEKTLNFKFILVEIFRNFKRKAKQNLIFGLILKEKQSRLASQRIEQLVFQKNKWNVFVFVKMKNQFNLSSG